MTMQHAANVMRPTTYTLAGRGKIAQEFQSGPEVYPNKQHRITRTELFAIYSGFAVGDDSHSYSYHPLT